MRTTSSWAEAFRANHKSPKFIHRFSANRFLVTLHKLSHFPKGGRSTPHPQKGPGGPPKFKPKKDLPSKNMAFMGRARLGQTNTKRKTGTLFPLGRRFHPETPPRVNPNFAGSRSRECPTTLGKAGRPPTRGGAGPSGPPGAPPGRRCPPGSQKPRIDLSQLGAHRGRPPSIGTGDAMANPWNIEHRPPWGGAFGPPPRGRVAGGPKAQNFF